MLTDLKQTQQKYGGANTIIDNWLPERQDLLVKYCHLIQQGSALPQAEEVVEFCQVLVDYLSAGHFEIFEILIEDDASGLTLKDELYPRLAETTDAALSFNDAFADAISPEQAAKLDKALANLGEILEERFALEDELIAHVHKNKS